MSKSTIKTAGVVLLGALLFWFLVVDDLARLFKTNSDVRKYSREQQRSRFETEVYLGSFTEKCRGLYTETVEKIRTHAEKHKRLDNDAAVEGIAPKVVEDLKGARIAEFIAADKAMEAFRADVVVQKKEYERIGERLNRHFDRNYIPDSEFFAKYLQIRQDLDELNRNAAALEDAWMTFKKTEKFNIPWVKH